MFYAIKGGNMLSRLLRNIGLEALDEIGDEIEDLIFGNIKDKMFELAVGAFLVVVGFTVAVAFGYIEPFG